MSNWTLSVATGALILGMGMASAQKAAPASHRPIPTLGAANSSGMSTVSILRATPSTIPFMANNPGGGIPGGSIATLTWSIAQGKNGQMWSLMVGAASSSFSGCTTVPVSAISLTCVSASVDGGGQVSASCNTTNFTTLPNTLPGLQLASGNEGNSSSHNYTVQLSYQLTDSWRYIANSCPLNVSYTVNTQ